MPRLLPFIAIALAAFAIGAAWGLARQRASQRARSAATPEQATGFGVLLWVPVGCGIAAAVVALIHTALAD